ncbi:MULTISPECIES: DUF6480 family protein [unclassified Amycolatopsis]|uniref:DUF6480 family protein n=1 Tax=unclassified Amycolatopsis TaxID=2618356 RepID=UPI002874B7A5|nr:MULTISPECIES: DUF6480 family protein [unclassified Amycolatopsis]MDS0135742.1 hypothetical protein [Amycolatopsis sp. 505]MDS0145657.1 hypothetical protein [Amycolatopsis sp. CM201R]
MTAPPPDPDPRRTPDLEPGGGVPPGSTPPDSAQTSGLSHPQPMPSKAMPVLWLVLTGVLVLMVAGLVIALAVGWLSV